MSVDIERKNRKSTIKTDTGEAITYDLESRDCKKSAQGETDVPILYPPSLV